MSERIEPGFITRISFTPLRDLFHGEVTGRLHWRHVIASSALPIPIALLVTRVVRRTRLWQRERRAVATELIAHFHDALATGQTPEKSIESFGDERAAARLIRRAKKRNRPLIWHAWKYALRGFYLVLALYALILLRFIASSPTIKVDYVAEFNAPTLAAKPEDVAWPLYRSAMLSLGVAQSTRDDLLSNDLGKDRDGNAIDLLDLTSKDAEWPIATKWLDDHADGLALLRAAAAKPVLGYIAGRTGSESDADLFGPVSRPPGGNILDGSFFSVLLPQLTEMRELVAILALDSHYAQSQRDGDRFVADVDAMLGIAAQMNDPILVTRLVGIGVNYRAFSQLERVLSEDAALLSDAQLIRLAHRLSLVGGDAPSSLIDIRGERMMFYDIIQRTYSDDGHGDGILTSEGARAWPTISTIVAPRQREDFQRAIEFASIGALSAVTSRRAVVAEYDRLMNLVETRFAKPLRASAGPNDPADQYLRRVIEIKTSPMLTAQYLPIALLMPSLDGAAKVAERLLGQREGLQVGIALELHRRRHGNYPATLSELAPAMLPRVPADRITGEPVKYKLIDGRPVVYSVGCDRDDDAGRAVQGKHGGRHAAAVWKADEGEGNTLDGDWILFDGRANAPER